MIGITGGIGSGKSTIARMLAERGYRVYDCDEEAKRIIVEDEEVRKAIVELLGEEAFIETEKGWRYNIEYVARRVFGNEEERRALNAIVHPAVGKDIMRKKPDMVESAILFESGIDKLCDKIIIVEATEEIRTRRTIERDYHGEATSININKVRARIRTQESHSEMQGERIMHVNNDGQQELETITEQIIQWIKQ